MKRVETLLEAIKNSEDIEGFFLRALDFLKEYCKKIEIIWEEIGGSIKQLMKLGRKKIEIKKLDNFPEIKENGYKIVDASPERLKKLILKVKLKSIVSEKKFLEAVQMIANGADIVCEKSEKNNQRKKIERYVERIEQDISNIAKLYISICNIEEGIKKIFEIMEKLEIENSVLIITQPETKKFKMRENGQEIERKAEEILSSPEEKLPNKERTDDGKFLEIFPINLDGKQIGVLVVKHSLDNLPFWFEKIIPAFISGLIYHRNYEIEKEKEYVFDTLNDLSIGVAIFSKDSPNAPIFKNERFQEYTSKLPLIKDIIKEDVLFSINLMTESLRKIEINGYKFLISTHRTKNEREILIEIIELKHKED